MDYFYSFMKTAKLRPESRFEAYARSIRLFMVQGHVQQAFSLYSRMQDEGYIPPRKIQASLFFVQKLATGDSTEELLEAAEEAFTHKEFDEEEFRHVLRTVSTLARLPSSVYDDLIRIFVNSREKAGYMLSSKTEALLGYIRTRRGWTGETPLENLSEEETTPVEHAGARSEDIDALLEMAKNDREMAPIIHSTIRRIRHTDGSHDRIFYNLMISALADQRRYADLFSVYSMMLRGNTSILPDAYTFGTLFRAIERVSGPRSIRNRKHKAPKDLPSLRALYRDMVYCHRVFEPGVQTASSPVLKAALLNRILRYFVDAKDFSAAYVALKSFDIFKLPVTVSTYHAVVGGIMVHIGSEMPYLAAWSEREQYWTYRFLGSPETMPSELDARLMDGVLGFGFKASLASQLEPIKLYSEEHLQEIARAVEAYNSAEDERDIPELTYRDAEEDREQQEPAAASPSLPKPYRRVVRNTKPNQRSYRVPTAACILGLITPPVDIWDAQPLLRIVKRAILASRTRLFLPGAKVVSMEIRQARTEMLPVLKPPTKETQRPTMASPDT
ncbi:hypothetical protein PsYK624_138470 [Phanerochaete sordida]|uniref:Uncharacterized protein n=1 Tax=Phanerochaete sordida TaxID=48140 RepID=A0A9P3GMA8_9APHY|nr:hypothetical protein PsYK624_138470 [Phanerochaete sordida]